MYLRQRCLMILYLMILFFLIASCESNKEGMYLVLEVKLEKAIESYLEKTVSSIKDSMREKGIVYDEIDLINSQKIDIKLITEKFVSLTEKLMYDFLNFEITNPVEGDNTRFQLSLRPLEIERIKLSAFNHVLEIIRNRIDKFGIKFTIKKQGSERIIIKIPDIKDTKDTKRLIAVICKTAQLEFKLVDDKASLDKALNGDIPPEYEILYEKILDRETGRLIKKPYLLNKRPLMTGNMIRNAEVRIGGQYGEAFVAISFDKSGTKLFEQITSENIGRRLAIILDKNIYSAPIIREKISGGRAQITGRFTTEEAYDLANMLTAGAFPAPVFILKQEFK